MRFRSISVTVRCPIFARDEQIPVCVVGEGKDSRFLVNSCDNAPGSSPVCDACGKAVWSQLVKDREQSEYTG